GLYDVIVGTGVQSAGAIIESIARGDDKSRQVPDCACTNSPQKLHAVGIWQSKVQNQRVIGSDRKSRAGIFGAANGINSKATFDQVIRDHLTHRGVVLNQ